VHVDAEALGLDNRSAAFLAPAHFSFLIGGTEVRISIRREVEGSAGGTADLLLLLEISTHPRPLSGITPGFLTTCSAATPGGRTWSGMADVIG
jgi:hypothetical protein